MVRDNRIIPSGGWADPRRLYSERETEFLQRIPDGFIRWPEDHTGESSTLADEIVLDVAEIESSGESWVLILPRNVDVAEFRRAWDEAIETGRRILFVCGEGAAIVPARQVVGYVPFEAKLTSEQDIG